MKRPEILRVDPLQPDPGAIGRAAAVLRAGGLVAFPTETVYGLGANGLDPAAVARIYRAKGRPEVKGLILHLAAFDALAELVEEVPEAARRLMARFAPGPLTLVLRARPVVPEIVRGGGPTVAVRWPDHPVARALIEAAGVPVAAPSANPSGAPPPTDAAAVLAGLAQRFDLLVDGGPTPLRVASTLVDLTVFPPAILREGTIPAAAVRAALAVGGSEG
jgi:L-threonylcarbamoyladenylate synthase